MASAFTLAAIICASGTLDSLILSQYEFFICSWRSGGKKKKGGREVISPLRRRRKSHCMFFILVQINNVTTPPTERLAAASSTWPIRPQGKYQLGFRVAK